MTEQDLGPLAGLVGRWRGQGHGDYPTIEPFDYVEEVVFATTGKPIVSYTQATSSLAGRPMHAEAGWVRWLGDGAIEWVLAQPTGIAEVAPGTFREGVLEVASVPHLVPSAVEVTFVRRRYRLVHSAIEHDLWMATAAVPNPEHHLHVRLERV